MVLGDGTEDKLLGVNEYKYLWGFFLPGSVIYLKKELKLQFDFWSQALKA